MKVFRPGFKPQYLDELEPTKPVPAVPTQAEQIAAARASAAARHALTAGLRQDGPTLAEYVAAGYDPSTYPPKGYAANPTKSVPPTGEATVLESLLNRRKALFGNATTEVIPAVAPKPLVDNNVAPTDPIAVGNAQKQVDPLLK